MIKNSIQYALIFFVVFTLYQWFFKTEIDWKNIIGISVAIFLVYLFMEWASKSRKDKQEDK